MELTISDDTILKCTRCTYSTYSEHMMREHILEKKCPQNAQCYVERKA